MSLSGSIIQSCILTICAVNIHANKQGALCFASWTVDSHRGPTEM